MIKIVFLILNYETFWETQKCVESIFDCMEFEYLRKSYEIVIVENGSSNGSYEKLLKSYQGTDGIYILHTKKNLGFAKGNNLGFVYAKNQLKADFIVMINSDIILTDHQFEQKLLVDYDRTHFDIAGPNVVLNDGTQLNPGITYKLNVKQTEKEIAAVKRMIFLCKLKIEPFFAAFRRIKSKVVKSKNIGKYYNFDNLDCQKGYCLHGCFLIFSPCYIRQFDGIYDRTFLFYEETLLTLRCIRAKLKMSYLEDICALHNESITQKYIEKNINKRHLRKFKYMLDSLNTVRDYLMSNNI